MGLDLPASVTCDKCGVQRAAINIVLTKLRPQPEMHLRLPAGWTVSSLAESGELLITCPSCPSTLVTVPPVPIDEDPATGPTEPPPAGG
jgi:hypothetical protein